MKIGLIGIGESGRDTVVNFYERYKEQDVFGMEIAVVDTDVMALAKFDKEHRKDRRIQKILVGKKTLKGMDPERRPDLAYIASVESEKNLVKFMKGMDFVFFAVSLGETVGAGLTPAILKAARKAGATPIIVVTLPPNIKDNFQTQTALHAVNSILRQVGNGAMVYSNSDFNDVDWKQATRNSENTLNETIITLFNLIMDKDATINIDANDVKNSLADLSTSLFFTRTESGFLKSDDSKADKVNGQASDILIKDIVFDNRKEISMKNSGNLVISVQGSKTILSTQLIKELMRKINEEISKNKSGNNFKTIFGVTFDENLGDKLMVSGVATNISFGIRNTNDFVSLEDVYADELKKSAIKTISREQILEKLANHNNKNTNEINILNKATIKKRK